MRLTNELFVNIKIKFPNKVVKRRTSNNNRRKMSFKKDIKKQICKNIKVITMTEGEAYELFVNIKIKFVKKKNKQQKLTLKKI